MNCIKELLEKMHEELEDCESYLTLATSWKNENKNLSDMYFLLAKGEVEHFNKLHEQATKWIATYQSENQSSDVITLYNLMEEDFIHKITYLKTAIDSYN